MSASMDEFEREFDRPARDHWRRDHGAWFDPFTSPAPRREASRHERDPLFDGYLGTAGFVAVIAVFVYVLARAFGVWA